MNIRSGVHPVLSVVEAIVETRRHLAEILMWDPIICLEEYYCKSKLCWFHWNLAGMITVSQKGPF